MTLKISGAAAMAACDALTGIMNGGSGDTTLVVYSGTAPATVGDALSGNTALVTFTLTDPAFPPSADSGTGATSTVDTGNVPQVAATADGTATFFRIFDGDGNATAQGDVTVVGGGGDLELSSVNIVTGVDVIMVALSVTMPKG